MVLIKSGKYRGAPDAGPVSARDFFTLLWPYRKRAGGPEKDVSFEQLNAALAGDSRDYHYESLEREIIEVLLK